jgi:hypothetical protein
MYFIINIKMSMCDFVIVPEELSCPDTPVVKPLKARFYNSVDIEIILDS